MRIATFNVENMFERPLIMNQTNLNAGKAVLADFARLSDLIENESYTKADKDEMIKIMSQYKGLINNEESTYIRLRLIRGQFVKKGKAPSIIATGRADWIGWFELTKETVKETATENTGRVIHELKADVMCVVEAEDRIALKHFNNTVMPKVGDKPFEHVMLIDGNDNRGIDVGILVREPYTIEKITSHVDDQDSQGIIFSRDCAEYVITWDKDKKEKLLVLVNHLKSKGYGSKASSDAKRKRQAERVREIYEQRRKEGYRYIAIVGDFNDTPDSPALGNLIQDDGLVDIMKHDKFVGDKRPGTYGNGTKAGKFDYILMSPELSACVVAGGIERRGVWGGKDGSLFPHFDEVKNANDAASDHAALWAEVNFNS